MADTNNNNIQPVASAEDLDNVEEVNVVNEELLLGEDTWGVS